MTTQKFNTLASALEYCNREFIVCTSLSMKNVTSTPACDFHNDEYDTCCTGDNCTDAGPASAPDTQNTRQAFASNYVITSAPNSFSIDKDKRNACWFQTDNSFIYNKTLDDQNLLNWVTQQLNDNPTDTIQLHCDTVEFVDRLRSVKYGSLSSSSPSIAVDAPSSNNPFRDTGSVLTKSINYAIGPSNTVQRHIYSMSPSNEITREINPDTVHYQIEVTSQTIAGSPS